MWVLVAQSCPTLCNTMDCIWPDSSVHGISQARILEWVAISSSRGSSWPSNQTQVFCIAGRFFTIWATREDPSIPLCVYVCGCVYTHTYFIYIYIYIWASLIAQLVKNLPPMQMTQFHLWVGKIRWRSDRLPTPVFLGFPCGSDGKESTCNAGDLGSIPGLGRSPGEGKGYPLQYSGLENSMDCIVHGVTNSQESNTTECPSLSYMFIHTHIYITLSLSTHLLMDNWVVSMS